METNVSEKKTSQNRVESYETQPTLCRVWNRTQATLVKDIGTHHCPNPVKLDCILVVKQNSHAIYDVISRPFKRQDKIVYDSKLNF